MGVRKKMISEEKNAAYGILEHLKKQGSANTFRLARELGMNRSKLLNILREFREKGAVEFKEGTVKFLKFPEEKKVEKNKVKEISSEIKEELPEEARKTAPLEDLQAENKNLGGESWRSELEKTIKESKQKASENSNVPPEIAKETKPQKTKAPKFNLTRLKNNLTKLNKNIQQLRVPKILKKEVDKNV